MNKNIQHIIKDPVYGTMSIRSDEHDFIKPFIDHPLMQRLRHIKQLSFVDLIFPGAVHTRFNHSLGCSYLCSRIYGQLYPDNKEPYEHRLVALAGLLHDIGHGPFSHAFEDTKIFKDKKIKHEDWFEPFADELFVDIKIDKQLQNDLKLIFKKDFKGKPWIASTVSSQLDADRMDYILRDSHFCGVKYGVYDLEWLLSCFTLSETNHLAITDKGIGSAEQFLHARLLLHKNVYFNVKASVISKMVINFIDHVIDNAESLAKISRSNQLINFALQLKKHESLDKKSFIDQIYNEYKNLVDYDVWSLIRDLAVKKGNTVCHKIAQDLFMRKLPYGYYIKPEYIDYVKNIVDSEARKHRLSDWQIDVVSKPVGFYKDSDEPIYALDRNGVPSNITSNSSWMDRMSNQTDSLPFLYVDSNIDKNIIENIIKVCNQNAALVYK